MANEQYCGWISKMQEFFNRSTSALDEADSAFAPAEGMYTAAQQVAHVADTINWFIEGGLEHKPWNMDFEALDRQVRTVTSLAAARAQLDAAFTRLLELTAGYSPEDMMAPVPDGPMLPGMPRVAILSGIEEHTAHHRGALSVYARLIGKVPPLPYMATAE